MRPRVTCAAYQYRQLLTQRATEGHQAGLDVDVAVDEERLNLTRVVGGAAGWLVNGWQLGPRLQDDDRSRNSGHN